MKEIIQCPYCNTPNDFTEFLSSEEHSSYNCADCEEEIWENIPKRLLAYESFYFVLNVLVYLIIIFVSAKFFTSYPEWRGATGFIFTFTIILASLSLHEFFHAFFAFVFGDFTIYRKGYLRLNLFNYINRTYSIFLPGLVFIFTGVAEIGAAVYVQFSHIRTPIHRFVTNVSGVFSQLIFLFIIMYVIKSETLQFSDEFLPLLHFAAGIQLIILVLNLLPIPGLDGWNAILCFFPFKTLDNYSSKFSIFFILAFFGAIIMMDGFAEFLFVPLFQIMGWVGIDENLWLEGFFHIQLISFETLELITERFTDLFFNTVGN